MSAASSSQPERIGAYEFLATLGQGGMAQTFIAMRHGPDGFQQRVCLKRILSEHNKDPEFVRQFLAEANIAASVSHANLVKVLDFGNDPEGYFLALELVQGMDLSAVFHGLGAKGQLLDPDLVAYIAIELATGLEVLHRPSDRGVHGGLVHRDVSPSNVLISYDGEVKLADFGIARAVDGPKHTRTGIIKGKVPYMAPSYARTAQADARCDLYAVGVVLFELLAGRRPYQGQTDLITLELAAKGEHDDLATLAPAAPEKLVAITERLIHPDPEWTFQSATELLAELSTITLAGAKLRRELGELLEQLRPYRGSVFDARALHPSSQPSGTASTKALSQWAATPEAGPAEPTLRGTSDLLVTPRPESRRRLWQGIGALLLIVATWIAWFQTGGDKTAASTHAPNIVAPATEVDDDLVPIVRGVPEQTPVAAGVDDAVAAISDRPSDRRAVITVVVVPFGEVIIDGKSRGNAPVTAKLTAGSHEITVVRPGAHTSQQVTLAPGETRRVVIK